jgi:hypothetical protein
VIPTILITASSNWVTTARLGVSFAQANCRIEAICPASHAIRKTTALSRSYAYHALSPVTALRQAILAAKPDLVVPADDLSTQHLLDLHAQEKAPDGHAIRELIERSLGAPESFPFMIARNSFMKLAQQEGVRVPNTAVIRDVNDLRSWASESGFPAVLKADGSSSGEGTQVVHDISQAEQALRTLQAPLHLARVLKRALFNRDLRSVRPRLEGRRAVVNAQEYIAGRDATSLVACWKGQVLAGLHFEVIKKQYKYGPASVMRLIENPEIESFVARVVRRLCLSGLHGFDFLLQDGTELPYMIELNPRSTQVGHLSLGPGRDLPGALCAALTGKAARQIAPLTDNPVIALFPQEWLRDRDSVHLQNGYHDVPWEEPELIRACLRSRRKWPAWQSLEEWSRKFRTSLLM